MPLTLRILGGFQLMAPDDRAVKLPTRKAEALLGYLAVPPGQTYRRDRVAALLWGDRGDKQARHSLSQTLFSIRKACADTGVDPVVTKGEDIALDPASVNVDAQRFEHLVAAHDPDSVAAAVDLYAGDLLAGLNLRENDFDHWLVAERIRLRELAMIGLEALLDIQMTTGQTDAAVQTALRFLSLEPLEESVHRTLMQLYADQGRYGAALRQYELCRRSLQRELDIAPETETEVLYRQIADQRAGTRELVGHAAKTGDHRTLDEKAPVLTVDDRPDALSNLTRSERKYLTVLCAEVVSKQAAGDDPEADLDILGPAQDALDATIARYGGSATNRHSHVITALFGAPATQEDHAVRACYAALDMREVTNRMFDGRLHLRIGLSSGTVVVRAIGGADRSRYEAVGKAVNFAGQIQQSISLGTIAVDSETRRLTEAFIEMADSKSVAHTGARHPADVFAIERRKAVTRPWQARLAGGLTQFVGRDAETTLLRAALDLADSGKGQILAIVGEPGVGKSRLVHEFVGSPATREWKVLTAGANALETSVAYSVIRQLLHDWFGVTARDLQAEMIERARQSVLGLDESLAATLPVVFSLTDLPVDDEEWQALNASKRRRRIVACVKALICRLSEEQPLLIVLEDLHWIDSESQTVLNTLIDSLNESRLFLLVTHRPEYQHNWLGRSGFSFVRLDPLTEDSAEQFLRNQLGSHPSVSAVTRLLVERTGGTPLFLEETVRELVERGALVGTAGEYQLNGPVGELDIPTSVQAVLSARIDRLPVTCKSLLEAAAVVGTEVEDAILYPISHLSEEEYYECVATLKAAEFLFEERQLPDVAYAFKHALTHDVAYNNLLRDQKRALHVAVLRAIEEVHRQRLDEQIERLAIHALSGGLTEEALEYLYQAALRAIRYSAHEQAIAHISKGLALLQDLSETPENLRRELDFRKALGVTMMAARGWGATEVSDAYTRARVICEKLGDDDELFTALRGQGQFHMIRGELRTARELGDRCIVLSRSSADDGVQIETRHLLWSNSFFMGDYSNAMRNAEAGIQAYNMDTHHQLTFVYSGHDPGVCCRVFSGLTLWQQGFPEQAMTRCKEALALAQELSHPLTLALAYWALSYLHMFQREPGAAREWAEREIAICDEYVMPLLLSQGLFQSGWALARQGEVAKGVRTMEEGIRRIRETGSEMGLPYFIALLGEAYAAAGDIKLGLSRVDDALATAEQSDAYFGYPEMLRLRGTFLSGLNASRNDDAEACLTAAVKAAQEQNARLFELRAAVSLARCLVRRGDRARSRKTLEPVYERFTEGFSTLDLKDAKAILDELS